MFINGKRPNFLIIMTDEERFPPPYETPEASEWRLQHSKARQEIASHGLELRRHYAGATACAPSRTTLFTGQYPSLHGVSQTSGMAKAASDPAMFWLPPHTVPTMGNYLRAGGYQTYYKGKWHLSDADLMVPGSNNGLLSNDSNGQPFPEKLERYAAADCLDVYGFQGWIGPEPHGNFYNNTGTLRDPGFAHQAAELIKQLEQQDANDDRPWLMVSSFVNPHDIVFSGPLMRAAGWFPQFYDVVQNHPKLLPDMNEPPTAEECLQGKPRVQRDYVLQYPRMYMNQPANETYFQFYYWLMAEVDKHIGTVYNALKASRFFENTIVILTSDHGDMLGAHGGMQQKWHNAYDESIHVPMVISNPLLFPQKQSSEVLTSHLDVLPTLLGLADIDANKTREALAVNHTEAQPLVGKDLSPLISQMAKGESPSETEQTVYFMTDDQVSLGLQQTNALNQPYRAIIQPNSVETAITRAPNANGEMKLWKISRYFDNPRFSIGVGNADAPYTDQATEFPVPDEWECYNLDDDPLENNNLLSPLCQIPLANSVEETLKERLREQSRSKRKLPHNNNKMPDVWAIAPIY